MEFLVEGNGFGFYVEAETAEAARERVLDITHTGYISLGDGMRVFVCPTPENVTDVREAE